MGVVKNSKLILVLVPLFIIAFNYSIFILSVNSAISNENFDDFDLVNLPDPQLSLSDQNYNEVDWSLYGQYFALTTAEGDIAVYDQQRSLYRYINYQSEANFSTHDRLVSIEWASEDAMLVVAYTEQDKVFKYDVEKDIEEVNITIRSPHTIHKSPDGMYLAVLSRDKLIDTAIAHIISVETLEEITTINDVDSLTWLGETNQLVVGNKNTGKYTIMTFDGVVLSTGSLPDINIMGNPVLPVFAVYGNTSVRVLDNSGGELFSLSSDVYTKFLISWDVSGDYIAIHDGKTLKMNIWNFAKEQIEFGPIYSQFDAINWLNVPGFMTGISGGVKIWSFPQVYFTQSIAYKVTPIFTSTIFVTLFFMFYYLGTVEPIEKKRIS